MNFSQALSMMKEGTKVSRLGWEEPRLLAIQRPDAWSKMTMPYIYMCTRDSLVPWTASQTDLLANDWCVIETVQDFA